MSRLILLLLFILYVAGRIHFNANETEKPEPTIKSTGTSLIPCTNGVVDVVCTRAKLNKTGDKQ